MSRGKRQLSLIGQVDARLNGMLALGHNRISVVGEHYITI